jgi:hypothetical protein
MEVALYARGSTPRQQQHQTIAQQLSRLRDAVATPPIGLSPTSTSTAMRATAAPRSSGLVSTACEIAAPWQPWNASSSPPPIG